MLQAIVREPRAQIITKEFEGKRRTKLVFGPLCLLIFPPAQTLEPGARGVLVSYNFMSGCGHSSLSTIFSSENLRCANGIVISD